MSAPITEPPFVPERLIAKVSGSRAEPKGGMPPQPAPRTAAASRPHSGARTVGRAISTAVRFVLATFWLLVGVTIVIGSFAAHKLLGAGVGLLVVLYSIYLYRGGRWMIFIW